MNTLLGILLHPLVLTVLIAGAALYMRFARPGGGPVQRVLRGIWIAVMVLFTAGFGLCGGFGLVFGLNGLREGGEAGAYAIMFVVVGGIGVLIAVAYGWGLWRTLKRLRAPATPEDRQP